MNAVFINRKAEAPNIFSFYFRTDEPINYTAGQFTQLKLVHRHIDERGPERWFTLSSSPLDDLLCITTKVTAKQGSSFKHALMKLKPGASLEMAEPMGDFVLPKLIQTPLVFVAGGIGITPFRAMMRWLAKTGEKRPIKLIYGVRSEDEILFQADMEAAKLHATIVVGEPTPAWGGERGRLSAEMIIGLVPTSNETLFYLSGPEPMIEALNKDLVSCGVKAEQIVGDFFPGYLDI